MPKVKQSLSNKLKNYVAEYNDFKTDGKILFCKVCNRVVSADTTFMVKQHLATAKHIQLKERDLTKKSTQQLFGECSTVNKDDQFAKDLCLAFIGADIPLYKMRNTNIRIFLEKYTDHKVPSETTLRTNYVNGLYKTTVENIRRNIKNHFVWIAIDETTDEAGRYVANVIVGIMHPDQTLSKQNFLLNTALLEKANYTTIARLFDESVKILGENFDKDKILLFLSDAAPYMTKAARAIQIFYPKITHLTCVAHGLHRVCEYIRGFYPKVDRLISNIKKVFLKAPSRIEIFKEIAPGIALPPQPITTRWGTWLAAVRYYSNNFESLICVFNALDDEEAASIKISKELLFDPSVKADIIFIAANYCFLETSITKLETSGLPLVDQIKIISDAAKEINNVQGEAADAIKRKFTSVIDKNYGFAVLSSISANIVTASMGSAPETYTIEEMLSFKFAPTTSVDVERSFSMYKSVFRSNRQSFLFENLSQIFVIYCNENLN